MEEKNARPKSAPAVIVKLTIGHSMLPKCVHAEEKEGVSTATTHNLEWPNTNLTIMAS